jgi:hypothetical protein
MNFKINTSTSDSPKTNDSSRKITKYLIGELSSIKKNNESRSVTEGSTNGKKI